MPADHRSPRDPHDGPADPSRHVREVNGISGDIAPRCCATFWPSGRVSAPVAIDHATRIDPIVA